MELSEMGKFDHDIENITTFQDEIDAARARRDARIEAEEQEP